AACDDACTNGETLPIRFVGPPRLQSSCGTAVRAIGPLGRYVAEACGAQPRAALVSLSGQSAVSQCTTDGRPARRCSAPSRTTCRNDRSVTAETVTCDPSPRRQERNQHRNATAIRPICICAEFS